MEEEETPKASRRGRSQNNTPVEVKRKPTLKEKVAILLFFIILSLAHPNLKLMYYFFGT